MAAQLFNEKGNQEAAQNMTQSKIDKTGAITNE